MAERARDARLAVILLVPLTLAGCAGADLTASSLLKTSSIAPAKETAAGTSEQSRQVLTRANAMRREGRRSAALRLLDKAAAKHPDDVAVRQTQALLALEVGQVERSEKLIRKALETSPGDWRLQSGLGAALAAQGRHKEAVVALTAALKLAPGQPAILNNLALSHAMAGNLETAEKLLRTAIHQNKSPAQELRAKQNLALVLGLRGKHGEARRIAAATMPVATANANVAYLQRMSGNKQVSRAEPGEQARSSRKVAQLPKTTAR